MLTPADKQVKLEYAVHPATGKKLQYYGMFAAPNAKTSDAVWQIQRMAYDADADLTAVEYPRNADGDASAAYSFVADNYASYTYGAA